MVKKLIAKIKSLFAKPKVRKFAHVNKFGDDTAYIEIGEEVFIVSTSGKRVKTLGYNLEYCLHNVSEGIWKEIE